MLFGHIHSTKEKLYGLFNLHIQLDVTIGENNKKGNAEWITAERCEWDLPDFEEEKFTIIDELLIQAPDEFEMDDAVTEKYLEEHPELKAWMEEGNV